MNIWYLVYRFFLKVPQGIKRIGYVLFLKNIPFMSDYVLDAVRFLQEESPDLGSSSMKKNASSVSHQYDLQIIVPIYNTGKYLRECLDSIFNQKTDYDYYVVAINDGSPDNSKEILKEYENHLNLKIIDQENKGFSGARNAGLEEILADYIMFVDSDDVLCDGAINSLLNIAKRKNVDIVQGSYENFEDNGRIHSKVTYKEKESVPQELNGFPWGKVYASKLWEHVCFPEKYWFEDTVNRLILFNISKSAYITASVVYGHRINPQGITSTAKGNKRVIDTIWVTKRLIEDFLSVYKDVSDSVCSSFILQCMNNYSRLLTLNNRKIDYAAFAVYRKLFEGICCDESKLSYKDRVGYNSLKKNDFKSFFLASVLL